MLSQAKARRDTPQDKNDKQTTKTRQNARQATLPDKTDRTKGKTIQGERQDKTTAKIKIRVDCKDTTLERPVVCTRVCVLRPKMTKARQRQRLRTTRTRRGKARQRKARQGKT
jgi:hypothetical protein